MQISEAADLATMGQSGLDLCNVKLEMEAEDSLNLAGKIFCPCGTSLPLEPIIQVIISLIWNRLCLYFFSFYSGANIGLYCVSSSRKL